MRAGKGTITVMELYDAPKFKIMSFSGRAAWALRELVQAGEAGCSVMDNPAPRWAS